jgi:hypothetical protein
MDPSCLIRMIFGLLYVSAVAWSQSFVVVITDIDVERFDERQIKGDGQIRVLVELRQVCLGR